jgi:hypothetical protein
VEKTLQWMPVFANIADLSLTGKLILWLV